MFIDDITITLQAGNGGDGMVAFNKNLMSLGPTGGSGGSGGNIFFEGVSDLNALSHFRFKKVFAAENGQHGRHQFRDGRDGEELTLYVPVGTVIHNLSTGKDTEITKIQERVLGAKGGHGGKGNFLFRSSRHTSPEKFQPGLPGERFQIRLELKLIADVGFIGLPNVGKSSLLKELTHANPKVANYPFTTLEPNLGVYYELILADIPGLIEGASQGKGLGHKFLRHIERTKILFHFVSADSKDPLADYQTVRNELETYNPELVKKPEYIFLSKSDTIPEADLPGKFAMLQTINPSATTLSIHDTESIARVEKILRDIIKQKLDVKN